MIGLDGWVDEKDSRICIYVDLEERQEMEGHEDLTWMVHQESQEGKVKGHKDPKMEGRLEALIIGGGSSNMDMEDEKG